MHDIAPAPGERLISQDTAKKASHVDEVMGKDRYLCLLSGIWIPLMTGRSIPRRTRRRTNRRLVRRSRWQRLWQNARLRRHAWRVFRRSPPAIKVVTGVAFALALSLAANGIYQIVRKPSELFFPVSGALYKMPAETWREYGPLFKRYSTSVMTPDLLAAIAQVEGSGNPLVRTYWRWSWTLQPFEMYRPASSAVGMYQITDGTFAQARRYCIRDHAVVEEGPWNDWRSCWFGSLYARVIPAHAVELTSAYLDRAVETALRRHGLEFTPLARRQTLAALVHLCGAGAGDDFARRGFRLKESERCGDHDVRTYLARVEEMKVVFRQLARESSDSSAE